MKTIIDELYIILAFNNFYIQKIIGIQKEYYEKPWTFDDNN